ncbi:MAG TPA: TlpA disulfide reductase family protein [Vicinamibacterales bacterium]|nr:TlpA disulfide reductase family protein [Vicinamibacterales bacterium]
MRVFVVVAVLLGVVGARASAQSYAAFGFKPSAEFAMPAFRDDEIAGFMGTLDRLLATDTRADSWTEALRQFARRLQTGRLSAAQEQKVLAHLDQIGTTSAAAKAAIAGPRRMIRDLTIGKTAPDVTGTDLDGRAFRLSDYRDRVVVLEFSAEWCGICRSQEPYQRFLLDRYEKWPFALLGVQTGSSREAARQAQLAGPLSHRSWWDAPTPGEANGPIAGAWNVIGWPATYVIDGDGVIRFVDVRDEDLLRAVRQLVDAQVDRDIKAKRTK